MGIFDFWKTEKREEEQDHPVNETSVDAALLRALMSEDAVTKEMALNIPAINACVDKIADTVASLELKLYKRDAKGQVEEVKGDTRVKLLNKDTGDTLDGSQFKKAMVVDMLLDKGGYAYVNKDRRTVKSIHYVEANRISFATNSNPIFKDYRIVVNGHSYEGFQFIKLLRNTKNGYEGTSIIDESPILLSTIYNSLVYEKQLVSTGGNKKGFIQSARALSEKAMTALKEAFRNLYSNNTENVVVLNEGLSFKESSNSSVEMQLNENKQSNENDICKVFLVPPSIINGGATAEDKKLYLEGCIMPILERFQCAVDRVLLLEAEKTDYFFAFDTSDMLKADIEKRFEAYQIACKNGFMQIDEIRARENLPAFGLDFIKLGLQDVLYYPKDHKIYTPNMNQMADLDTLEQTQDLNNPQNPTDDKTDPQEGDKKDVQS
jgi:HK97 family phage portal protein